MYPFVVLILLFIVVAVVLFPIIALVKATAAKAQVEQLKPHIEALQNEIRNLLRLKSGMAADMDDLARRLAALEFEHRLFKESVAGAPKPESEPQKTEETPKVAVPAEPAPPAVAPVMKEELPASARAPEAKPREAVVPAPAQLIVPALAQKPSEKSSEASKPVSAPRIEPVPAPRLEAPPAPPINWEQFMGAKLFAWIGGFALFFGIAFFVKYSFEQNLIPPEVRVAIGFLCGIGLLIGGVVMKRKETAVTAQTLCSTGVLVLYAVTFACRALYHFRFFDVLPTFLLMTLITAVAFLLSVRMNALVVAVLGMAGGFLTPVLLSTGHDAPFGLFGYIALLDIGLLAVALHRQWKSLPVLGVIGTVAMQAGWVARFFVQEKYYAGNKVLVAMAVFAGFQALFLIATAIGKRLKRLDQTLSASALVPGVAALAMAFFFLLFPALGQRPVLLFSYVFLIDLGFFTLVFLDKLRAAAESLAGLAIFVLLGMWTSEFFRVGHLHAILAFYLLFALFHLAAPAVLRRFRAVTLPWWSNVVPVLVLPFYFLSFHGIADHPVLLFGSVFLVSLGLLASTLCEKESASAEGLAGASAFLLLGIWTGNYLTGAHLYAALAFYFVFALFHSAAPLVMHRWRGMPLPWWSNAFPALALLLVLMPVFKLAALSILIWPLVLFIDVIAIVLAVVSSLLLPVLLVMLLTLAVTGAWIFQIPSELTGLPTSLFMLGGFAVFFIVVATWVSRKVLPALSGSEGRGSLFGDAAAPANLAVQIPAMSATLPFLLLIMLTLRLPLANPSPVFGLALLLVVLLLGLSKIMALEALPAVGLACVVALEHAWHFHHFNPAHASLPLAWYLIFYAVFTLFPFLFHRQFAKSAIPWATAALAGPAQFYLLYHLLRAAHPGMSGIMGLVPAAFSVPALLGLLVLMKRTPFDSPARNTQLAWFGGIALFFITLIFPIQFERQWITIGWALEGAALCWLFHRVPHRGLRLTGVGLVMIAFARLALNPEVLSYHARSAAPVFNWYLYAYGITAVCLFVAARLLAPPRNMVAEFNMPPILWALGTILCFLLVNIEIADYFSAPGTAVLTFQFSGNFARDMSYSIAWALFALLLLIIGIGKRLAPVRYASIGLLAVVLLKLFLHDLSNLDQLYRIAAFIVVAVIAMLASFLYQRFLGSQEKTHENKTPPVP